jgi:filamentous hemagglutinin
VLLCSTFALPTLTYAAQTGVSVGVSASKGKGSANGSDTTYTNTHINAGDKVSLQSGADTNLKGAVITAPQVQAQVGGNLQIESLQDSSTYNSQQSNKGISLSIPIAGTGKLGGSISAGKANINSDYQSTTEQSAIRAGDGGFQITTAGDTQLTGGQITSTQTAIDNNKNSFTTGGTLTTQDLHNTAEYDAKAVGVQLGTSVNHTGQYQASGTSAGVGKDSGSISSTTTAGISGIAGDQNARTGDAQTGLANTFDAGKVQADINAQVQITQAFGQQASKAVGDYAQEQMQITQAFGQQASKAVGDYAQEQMQKAQALRAAGQEQEALAIEALWSDTGSLRLAAHTVIGGLTGGSSGAAGAAVGTLTAPAVADALAQAGIDGALASTLTALASTATGAAVGGTAGGAAGLNGVANNYLTHAKVAELQKCLSGKTCQTAEEKRKAIANAEKLSQWLDGQMLALCESNPTGDACRTAINTATQYIAMTEAWQMLNGDVQRSSQVTWEYVYNTPGAKDRMSLY